MASTFDEIKAIIVDLLGVDEAKVKPEARFREDLEAEFARPGRTDHEI